MRQNRSDFSEFFKILVDETASKFQYAYSREDLQKEYEDLVRLKRTSAYPNRRKLLVDHLCSCGVECGYDISEAMLQARIMEIPERQILVERLVWELYSIYREFPSPADHMERLVRRLGDPDLQSATVRLTILKQFLRYGSGKYLSIRRAAQQRYGVTTSQVGTVEQLLAILEDDIFDVVRGKLSRDEREKYELLICADDLARGRFQQQGAAKHMLYRFAFAFGMTVAIPSMGELPDRDRDISIRLFSDYYQNNLFRYLINDSGEAEPTGEGINPKNFAEIIFIYFLRRKDLERGARYDGAIGLIERCLDRAISKGGAVRLSWRYSKDYWAQIFNKIWTMDEDSLVEFLCENYEIPVDAKSRSRLTVAWEEHTALREYIDILDEMSCFDSMDPDILETELVIGGIDAYLRERDIRVDEDFRKLIMKMEQCLSPRVPEPHIVMAALAEDQGNEAFADQIIALHACMKTLRNLLAVAIPEEKKIHKVLQTVGDIQRQLTERADPAYQEKIRALRQLMVCCRNRSLQVTGRNEILQEHLDRAMRKFQEHMVSIRRDPRQCVRIPGTVAGVTSFAEGYHAVLISAEKAGSFISDQRGCLMDILDTLKRYDPVWEDVGPKCISALDEPTCVQYACILKQGEAYMQVLAQNVEMLGSPDLQIEQFKSLPKITKPKKLGIEAPIKADREQLAKLHRVSRTQLIALACHSYLVDVGEEKLSMPELLEDVRTSIDALLEQCRFQPISEKDLFDMFAVFALYLRITLEQR